MSGDPSLQPHVTHEKPPRRCDRQYIIRLGIYPGSAHVAYCTSKGAVAVLTKNFGGGCAPLDIRVNAVCPHEINIPRICSGFEN